MKTVIIETEDKKNKIVLTDEINTYQLEYDLIRPALKALDYSEYQITMFFNGR